MLVKNIMIPKDKLTVVDMSCTVKETIDLIDSKNLLSLPVVDGKNFVGVISKKYIFEDFFNNEQSKENFLQRPITEFMKNKIPCVHKEDIMEVAVKMLQEQNRQFIPVVDDKDDFSGIVTHKAIFTTLTNIMGFGHTRIVVSVHEMKGILAKLTDIISRYDANIISIATVDIEVMNLRQVILRVDVKDVNKLVKKLEDNGFRVRRIDKNV
ncbi:hypothetical protein AN639_11530 [Candidatus Epulonipiscium fishelsonii]|uniref:Uncharacterized protein n=1 Tax=Candidatus Epulonipiscium fishelsonii TaxID=77094 RepID=A0ACC8X8F1_9FIRM|nr:hypothetical protein AN396_11480 [Epulopiscium sp. SCG-B11WGA-EpuloA1]ONI43079.1 hypothetical protein AN639_11530 [Epulopiscium sp. SCG-B05WGA-EpuloA1]